MLQRNRGFLGCFVSLAVVLALGAAPTAETRRLLELEQAATQALEGATRAATAGDAQQFSRLAQEAAQKIDALAGETGVDPGLRKELKDAASRLRVRAEGPPAGFAEADLRGLLGRVAARIRGETDLPFQGSYSQTKVEEPVYGGHASAMGPPPEAPAATAGLLRSSSRRRPRSWRRRSAEDARRTTFSSPAAAASRFSITTATGGSTST